MLSTLKDFLFTQFQIVKSIATLAQLEAKLARASFGRLLVAVCVIAVLCLTTWMTLLVLLGYLITWITHQLLFAILGALIFNSLVLAIFIRYALTNIHNMCFEKTRKFLHQKKEAYDTQTVKKTNPENRMSTPNL